MKRDVNSHVAMTPCGDANYKKRKYTLTMSLIFSWHHLLNHPLKAKDGERRTNEGMGFISTLIVIAQRSFLTTFNYNHIVVLLSSRLWWRKIGYVNFLYSYEIIIGKFEVARIYFLPPFLYILMFIFRTSRMS
jgi:hypothetical protein